MLTRLRERGDTLIEVLFAVSIFSAVVVGTIVIMNQGIATAQQALEINLVRNQIDTQAELLRHLNNAKLTSIGRNATADSSEWDTMASLAGSSAQDYSLIKVFRCGAEANCSADSPTNRPCEPSSLPSNAFFISPLSGDVIRMTDVPSGAFRPAETFSQVQRLGEAGDTMISNMLWIQPVSDQTDHSDDSLTLTRYYDFHIRACWDSPGAGGGMMKLGTIVRLYVPKA